MNSRPLTYQSDNSRDIPLTPSQLAWGSDLTLMPPLLQPGDPLDEDYDAKVTRAQYVVLSSALSALGNAGIVSIFSLYEKNIISSVLKILLII